MELLANDGYQYTYNLMGNITAVKKGTRANMSALSNYRTYTYDAKGELTGETIYSGGSSTQRTYAYDGMGNLTSQTQTGVLGNKSISYTYGTSSSAGWEKMLNSVSVTENGNTTIENIVYDQIGNPTTYRGAAMTWFGRQLTNYSKSGTTASFTYDADGLRGKKTVNGTTSTYQYVNGHLAYEKRGNVQYFYFYDSFGKLSSIRFYDPSVSNGSAQNYFTLTNQQGDVVAIYNVAGTKVASYEYDAWGNILSTTDTSNVNISTRNPFRYRGYYYDSETGLYYLQSRYYDPEIGRFINADKQLSTGDMTGMNLYAYCGNNPVNGIDPTGEAWWHWALGAAIVVACAAATVVTCGGFAAAATAVCMVGSGVAAATTASTVAAAAFIGSATVYGTAVAFAASTSNSVQEFNDQGNMGVVVSTAFGGLVYGCNGYAMSKPQPPTSTPTYTSRGSTGRTEPADLLEQLAMEQVKSNPSAGTPITAITMNDPRWPSSEGWVKMQQIVPTSQSNINIHYVYNQTLNIFDDFKFES